MTKRIFYASIIILVIIVVNLHASKKLTNKDKMLQSIKLEYQRLKEWENSLKLKEEILKQMELELIKEQHKIEILKQKVTELFNKIKEIQNANVSSLAAIYSKMKPADSAKIINDMEEDLAVKIFLKMKPNKIAKVLKFISSSKAAKISEKLAIHGIKLNIGENK